MKEKNRFLLVTLLTTVLLASCFAPHVLAGKKDDTLNVAFSKELDTLDRYHNTTREGMILARHVYDNLLYRDPETYEYKGLLAQNYKWVNDTELLIELRQGVKFHNGSEMTADDVTYTLNYAADPSNAVKTQRYSNWIKEVIKTGPYSVKIIAKEPFPAALEFLSGANPIYPKSYYSKIGPDAFGIKPIGTGPYKLAEVDPGKKVVLVKNTDYFRNSPKGFPKIGKIVWRTLPERNTQTAELMTGALDWIYLVPPEQAELLAKNPKLDVVSAETMRIAYLHFDAADLTGKNGIENPFKDLKVRQAVNHAINRVAIAKNLVGGDSRPVYTACYETQFGCDQDVIKYEFNPVKAKQLLAEAGYPNGFETELHAYRDRNFAEAMIGDLAKVGIKAKLVMMKASALRSKSRAHKVPLAFWTWGSYSINDISAITSNFFQFEKDDLSRDEQVKDWLMEGDATIDITKRKEVYSKALKRIAEQAYWCPMFTYVSNNCFSKDLDFTPYPDAVPRFYQANWKK